MSAISIEIEYLIPNFENEWVHAEKYPEFSQMGKNNWIQFAKSGKSVLYKEIKNKLPDMSTQNFSTSHSNKFEMPIVVKFTENDYQLICTKQRLAKLLNCDNSPQIWLIDISEFVFSI
jgi:hypothetical protein